MFYLKEQAKQAQQSKTITLSERLPYYVNGPCELNATYHVEVKDDFYLIHLHVSGLLHLQCQRCLEVFDYPYDNNTIVAVCRDEERAEVLLEQYECIVSANLQIEFNDLIIDELHLYAPQFHPGFADCSSEINQFLAEKND